MAATVAIEEAIQEPQGDLTIRPIFHQDQQRVHIFIVFRACCLHVTLERRLHALAPGLSPRTVLEKFAAMQMIDVHVPTTARREFVLTPGRSPSCAFCSTNSTHCGL
jgi:hypothetical protein